MLILDQHTKVWRANNNHYKYLQMGPREKVLTNGKEKTKWDNEMKPNHSLPM